MRIGVLLPIIFFASLASAQPVQDAALLHGESIGVVKFSPGSIRLEPESKQGLGALVQKLKKMETRDKLLRVEGFATTGKGPSSDWLLSSRRASAVVEYLQSNLELESPPYVTAHVASTSGKLPDQVEIFLYDNIFETNGEVLSVGELR